MGQTKISHRKSTQQTRTENNFTNKKPSPQREEVYPNRLPQWEVSLTEG